ncbi:very short patch repair endonuclease [Rossellomorea aquimaris]|uniref:very short patch repair endonuclease n=1 Tax=Rossellomorea aquimaris TaxID=189382 RepID=UPI001CD7897D|nr:very short patch repair endonuclease [Rossellomorea aquimaris]MCA1056968.1 very short patch repair endonuclease [Rossellomorea aquimaris]
MANFSPEGRKRIMKSIKSRSKLEDKVSKEMWKRGYRFRKNVKTLKGKPDIAIKKYKVVIFIDSCFWHFCHLHGRYPKTNPEFWRKKLDRNKERDQEVNEYFSEKGWHILRVWEHEITEDFIGTINKIENFIKAAKSK